MRAVESRNLPKYLIMAPFMVLAFLLGWAIEVAYYNQQMQEVCGNVDYFEALVSARRAIGCLIPRDQAKIWLLPILFAMGTFFYLRARLATRRPLRKWPV